jgi:predicted phosphodiesterase
MRVLVYSDVHANRAALEAVLAEPHEMAICLGDLVGYGPEPGACVRLVQDDARVVVQGNHDRAVAEGIASLDSKPFSGLDDHTAAIAEARLTPEERAYLAELPHWLFATADGLRCLCVHATPTDPLYGTVLGGGASAWWGEVAGLPIDAVLVGNTHQQYTWSIAGVQVVSPGSVGLPADGDPRAAYAVVENGKVTLKRVAYPIEDTVRALYAERVPPEAAAALATWLRTGRAPAPVASEVAAGGPPADVAEGGV